MSKTTGTADLDIGVIYTHERPFMEPLLRTLRASGDRLSSRLILIDNASDDGAEQWEPVWPAARIVKNEQRLGYAPNLNRILAASTAPFVLVLNTDMYFEPAEQCLTKMVDFMRRHTTCGVSGCRLYRPDGSYGFPARQFQTVRVAMARRAGMSRLMGDVVDDYFYQHRNRYDEFQCDWLSGCFLMLRREAIQDVGRFDCRFAKYFEDVDICLRMARAGWQVMFNGGTYCYHHEQRASKALISRDGWQHMRSYMQWIAKWGLQPHKQVDEAAA